MLSYIAVIEWSWLTLQFVFDGSLLPPDHGTNKAGKGYHVGSLSFTWYSLPDLVKQSWGVWYCVPTSYTCSYIGTLLNGHPSTADTYNIIDISKSPDCAYFPATYADNQLLAAFAGFKHKNSFQQWVVKLLQFYPKNTPETISEGQKSKIFLGGHAPRSP